MPTCPFCRAEPSVSRPPPSTTPQWDGARRYTEFLRYPWDDSIPIERDYFFVEFLNLHVPSNPIVFVYQTLRGIHIGTVRPYENRRISRFLAKTKREAIQKFRFELSNLLDF